MLLLFNFSIGYDIAYCVQTAEELLDELEVDAAAFSEHRQNLRHKDNKHGFSQLFNGGEADVRSVVGHNVHENVSRVQQGGTSLLLFGDLVQHLDMEQSGCDDSGRRPWKWSVMTLKVKTGLRLGWYVDTIPVTTTRRDQARRINSTDAF